MSTRINDSHGSYTVDSNGYRYCVNCGRAPEQHDRNNRCQTEKGQ